MSYGARLRERLAPGEALALFGAAFVALPLLSNLLARYGLSGVSVAEVLAVLLPTLVALRLARAEPRSALGLEGPEARMLVAAVLVALGGFQLVAGGLEPLQERFAPMPPSMREQLRLLLVPRAGLRPLFIDLAALALLPALCEETLFRGALLRGISPMGRAAALVATAFGFGCFHYSLYKLLPTTSLGLLLGGLALRSGMLWPSLLAHAINNTLVVLLVRAGYEDVPARLSSPWLLLPAALLVVFGLLLAGPSPRRSGA